MHRPDDNHSLTLENPLAMNEEPQRKKLGPLPSWLVWVFLTITGLLVLNPALVGEPANVVPLVAANLIFLIWDTYAKRA